MSLAQKTKIILNRETGIYYTCLQDAADSKGMKKGTLWSMIYGINTNKTQFNYV